MEALDSTDRACISAAEGWLGLGDAAEAKNELANVSTSGRIHSEALDILWHIAASDRNWNFCLRLGVLMIVAFPNSPKSHVNHSDALRGLGRVKEAQDALLDTLGHFPGSWLIKYKLAAYESLLGNYATSLAWLTQAQLIGDTTQIYQMALNDADFERFFAAPLGNYR